MSTDKNCVCNCGRKKERSAEEYKKLSNRLSRIEGQLRGIKKMLEGDAYCIDILTQTAAASAALKAFGRELLENHIRSCVINDIRNGEDATVEELIVTIEKMMKN